MKKLKSGFTLAEVLITIAVIGIVATMVMPSVMTNHTYKTMGTKLTKFVAQIEDSARPFVVMNDSFETVSGGEDQSDSVRGLQDYLADSFILANEDEFESITNYFVSGDSYTKAYTSLKTAEATDGEPVLQLKDGTSLLAIANVDSTNKPSNAADDKSIIETDKVGDPVFTLRFSPNISGVPNSAQQSFYFVVTNLGYVFPDVSDACTLNLYKKGFNNTLAKDFKKGEDCNTVKESN